MVSTKLFTHQFVPDQSSHDPKTIMIIMHGLGDQLESYIPVAKYLKRPGLSFLLINAPNPYAIGHSWYDMPPTDPRPSITQSTKRLLDLILELKESGYAESDILLLGFSQGGAMTLETVQALKAPLKGAIALSPRVYLNPQSVSKILLQTPLFISHGQFDDVIPFSDTEGKIEEIRKDHKDLKFKAYPMGHEISQEQLDDIVSWLNALLKK